MKKVFGKFTIAAVIAGLLILVLAGTIFAAGPFGGRDNLTGVAVGANCGVGLGLGAGPDDAITKLLGMTREQIQEQRQAGKSLVQIAATKNVSEETLINAIIADKQVVIQKLVAAGTIVQSQADQSLAQMKERVKLAVNRTTVGPPEWAGANSKGQNGSGMMRQAGLNGNKANSTDAAGTHAGLGGMMRFGRSAK